MKDDVDLTHVPSENLAGGIEKPSQFPNAQQGLIERGNEAEGLQMLDELPLCADQVVAEDVDLLGLSFTLTIHVAYQGPQSLASIVVSHGHPS
jgi:hypothetical protein